MGKAKGFFKGAAKIGGGFLIGGGIGGGLMGAKMGKDFLKRRAEQAASQERARKLTESIGRFEGEKNTLLSSIRGSDDKTVSQVDRDKFLSRSGQFNTSDAADEGDVLGRLGKLQGFAAEFAAVQKKGKKVRKKFETLIDVKGDRPGLAQSQVASTTKKQNGSLLGG